jgi:two-component system, chemotaxis family, chemotaxis protein CheY
MLKILIVDDSSLSRRISRTILTEAGYAVVEAADGMSALENYVLEKPDLVFLDMTMKGMSGLDVLRKLREMNPTAKVVMATADIQRSTRTLTAEAGACGFVSKPFVATDVVQAVATALQGAT